MVIVEGMCLAEYEKVLDKVIKMHYCHDLTVARIVTADIHCVIKTSMQSFV